MRRLTLVQVVASISASSTQVKGVSFVIHGPVGSSLTKELLAGAGETYAYTADRVDTSYSTVTTVRVSEAAVPVTVTSSVLGNRYADGAVPVDGSSWHEWQGYHHNGMTGLPGQYQCRLGVVGGTRC